MESQQVHAPAPATNAATTWCRNRKSEGASFLRDLRDHFHDFIHTSMDDHKTCFMKTVHEVFGTSRFGGEKSSAGAAAGAAMEEAESSVPLKTTVPE